MTHNELGRNAGAVYAFELVDGADDQLYDVAELHLYGSDPALADTDSDSLQDSAEVHYHGTDPRLADSDGDGLDDGTEIMIDSTASLEPTNCTNCLSESSTVL